MLLSLALLRMTLNSKYRTKKIKAKNLRYRNIKIKTQKEKDQFFPNNGKKMGRKPLLKKNIDHIK